MLRSIGNRAGRMLAPRAGKAAPGPTAKALHRALQQAIDGAGPLDGASTYAEKALAEADGSVEDAVASVVSAHLRLAAAQGFLANLGGIATLAATVPANIAALTLLQCRMVAAIAALRGHDLDDQGVRNAILVSLLGEDAVREQVRKGELVGTPGQLARGEVGADAPVADGGPSELDRAVAAQVSASLISSVIGKRATVTVGKRVPLVGGVIGAGSDVWATRKVAAYARTELRPA